MRYFLGAGDTMIVEKPLTVTGASASVSAPASVGVGASFEIKWTGPNNARDFITVVKAGAPEKHYEAYAYTSVGNPVELRAPEQPGDYELRYLTGQTYATLATTKLSVTSANATLKGPASGGRRQHFHGELDGDRAINATSSTSCPRARAKATAARGPTRHKAILRRCSSAEGGWNTSCAIRWGSRDATLARTSIQITPGKEEPGLVGVTHSGAATSGNAVEIIFDASGSMLQKIGGKRRIDIARETLTKLTSQIIPAGTPFAMRVFGREVNSCQTDLFIPVSALDATRWTGRSRSWKRRTAPRRLSAHHLRK
ncbi:MAG: hypothetical protein WDO56_06170 [Gammaproteobacteria bacterium]